jgi:hypothetical protein
VLKPYLWSTTWRRDAITALPMTEAMNPHVEALYKDLINAISQGKSPETVRAELERDQEQQFGAWPDLLPQYPARFARYRRIASGLYRRIRV